MHVPPGDPASNVAHGVRGTRPRIPTRFGLISETSSTSRLPGEHVALVFGDDVRGRRRRARARPLRVHDERGVRLAQVRLQGAARRRDGRHRATRAPAPSSICGKRGAASASPTRSARTRCNRAATTRSTPTACSVCPTTRAGTTSRATCSCTSASLGVRLMTNNPAKVRALRNRSACASTGASRSSSPPTSTRHATSRPSACAWSTICPRQPIARRPGRERRSGG